MLSRLGILVLSLAVSGAYSGFTLSDDRAHLSFSTAAGARVEAPKTSPEQEGFDQPHLASSRPLAGWVALMPNCCTSYPLPLAVVTMKGGKVLRTFEMVPPVWAWSFARHDTAVATRQALPHGVTSLIYQLHRLSDGQQLEEFVCTPKEGGAPGTPVQLEYEGTVPDWVWPIAEGCPARPDAGR